MSNPFNNDSYNSSADQGYQGSVADPTLSGRPTHRVHDGSTPLPGAPGGRPPVDYNTERQDGMPPQVPGTQQGTMGGSYGDDASFDSPGVRRGNAFDSPDVRDDSAFDNNTSGSQGANAFNTDRPRDVQPTSQGGVAPGGRSDMPMGKASFMDKVIGKSEKVIGKVTKNPDMHETGELRETGGAAAARGDARSAHD